MYENDTYEFCFNSGNKIARVEIGQEEELTLTDVLRAVQDILVDDYANSRRNVERN